MQRERLKCTARSCKSVEQEIQEYCIIEIVVCFQRLAPTEEQAEAERRAGENHHADGDTAPHESVTRGDISQ